MWTCLASGVHPLAVYVVKYNREPFVEFDTPWLPIVTDPLPLPLKMIQWDGNNGPDIQVRHATLPLSVPMPLHAAYMHPGAITRFPGSDSGPGFASGISSKSI